MKTIDYKLKSSWQIVQLPEEYLQRAEDLIRDVSQIKSGADTVSVFEKHPYLANQEILKFVKALLYSKPNTEEEFYLRDNLFLGVSLYCANKDYNNHINEMKEAYESEEKKISEVYKKIVEPIIKTLEYIQPKNGKIGMS
jgi:hypothetical protein